RANTPVFPTPDTPFQIGKALTLWESDAPKVAILATGSLSYTALEVARTLAGENIGTIVLHVPTIKPLDGESLLAAARAAGRVLTIEEHQVAGGFGSAVAEFLSEHHPVPLRRLGIQDRFGQSGSPDELLAYYGLDSVSIENAVREMASK
ncbi:MAG: transketolase C-terminal domain-containing protein, partial [Patescibacteria group bacterium]